MVLEGAHDLFTLMGLLWLILTRENPEVSNIVSRTKEKLQPPIKSLSRACAGTDFARRGRVHSAVPEQPLLSRLTAENRQ